MSLIDKMLMGGVAVHLPATDGQPIEILSGPDAGKFFTGCVRTLDDQQMLTDIGSDDRGKRKMEFFGAIPNIPAPGARVRCRDERGVLREWVAVKSRDDDYLSRDFELIEHTDKDA